MENRNNISTTKPHPYPAMSKQSSTTYKIILAIKSPLLRDMLRRILINRDGFQIAGETTDWNRLLKMLKQISANWVITSLGSDGKMPQEVDRVLDIEPSVGVLAISHDGRQIRSQWLESHVTKIAKVSPLKLEAALTAVQQHLEENITKAE
jgi:DNA-binding NarL/FixJ family response regulator